MGGLIFQPSLLFVKEVNLPFAGEANKSSVFINYEIRNVSTRIPSTDEIPACCDE